MFSVAVKVSAKLSEICKNWVAVDAIVYTTVFTQCGAGRLTEAGPLWAKACLNPIFGACSQMLCGSVILGFLLLN